MYIIQIVELAMHLCCEKQLCDSRVAAEAKSNYSQRRQKDVAAYHAGNCTPLEALHPQADVMVVNACVRKRYVYFGPTDARQSDSGFLLMPRGKMTP